MDAGRLPGAQELCGFTWSKLWRGGPHRRRRNDRTVRGTRSDKRVLDPAAE